jgi:hypothetical protein
MAIPMVEEVDQAVAASWIRFWGWFVYLYCHPLRASMPRPLTHDGEPTTGQRIMKVNQTWSLSCIQSITSPIHNKDPSISRIDSSHSVAIIAFDYFKCK